MATISALLLSRFVVPLAGLLSLAIFACIYLFYPEFYLLVARMLILMPASNRFGDWDWVLWSIKCWSEGVNVYFVKTCSPLWSGTGGFAYSPFLLRLSFLKGALEWRDATMLSIAALFFLSLVTLPPLKNLRDQAMLVLATLSSAVWLGVERGNLDLVIFLLIMMALNLRILTLPFRLTGYALVLLAALLKFYPFVAFIIVLRERVSVLIAIGLATAAALVAFMVAYHQEFGWIGNNLPKPSYFALQFGSANLSVVLGVTVANVLGMLHFDAVAARAAGDMVTHGSVLLLTIMALLGAVTIARRCHLSSLLERLSDPETDYLIVGAALICGCFFTVNSHDFRGIFLLLTLPGLAALSRHVPSPLGGRVFGTACAAIPFVMWNLFFDMCLIVASHWTTPRAKYSDPYDAFPGFTVNYLLWLATELAWWWIVTVLLAILGAFVLRSDAWALLCRVPAGIKPPRPGYARWRKRQLARDRGRREQSR